MASSAAARIPYEGAPGQSRLGRLRSEDLMVEQRFTVPKTTITFLVVLVESFSKSRSPLEAPRKGVAIPVRLLFSGR